MYVTDIVNNSKCRNYLNQYIDINFFYPPIQPKFSSFQEKSDPLIGSVVEQIILVEAFKNQVDGSLQNAVNKHIDRIDKITSSLNSELKKVRQFRNSDLTTLIWYPNIHEFRECPVVQSVDFNSLELKSTVVFSDNFDPLECHYSEFLDIYFFQYDRFVKFANSALKELKEVVYSKLQVSRDIIARLVLFENLIIAFPIFLVTKKNEFYFQNAHRLFQDYSSTLKNVCDNVAKNENVIFGFGEILKYQEAMYFNNIRGRVDFLTKNYLIEIKTATKISSKDILQGIIYGLIAQCYPGNDYIEVKKVTIVYLMLCKSISVEISTVKKMIGCEPNDFLKKLIEIFESN